MNKRTNQRTNAFTSYLLNKWLNELTTDRTNGRTNERTNGQTNKRTNEWKNEVMNESKNYYRSWNIIDDLFYWMTFKVTKWHLAWKWKYRTNSAILSITAILLNTDACISFPLPDRCTTVVPQRIKTYAKISPLTMIPHSHQSVVVRIQKVVIYLKISLILWN